MSRSNASNKITPAALQAQLQQAIGLHQHGFLAQAEALYRGVLQARPAHPDALHLLGVLCVQGQRHAEGVDLIQRSVAINSHQSAPYSNLGNALTAMGRHSEAIAAFNKAIALKPDYAEALSNRGNALLALGRAQEALASYDKALALRPDLPEAWSNRGNALRFLQRHAEALASQDKALALRPDYAEAHMNRGTILADLRRDDEAVASYDKALACRPDYAEAYTNRGNALRAAGRLVEAAQSHERSLALNPNNPDAHANLGVVHGDMGSGALAAAAFRRALAINPDLLGVHSNLLLSLSHQADGSPEDYLAEARRFGERAAQLAQQVRAAQPLPDVTPRPLAGRRLRVGLVSGDLQNHPVGFFLETILAHLQDSRIELTAYATQAREDDLTRRIKPCFARWRTIAGMSDAAAAHLIVEDRIDVLLDLAGHTADNRLPLFAWKPAPVQASWLGYFASTGVQAIDHVLVDAVSVPPDHAGHFLERLIYLPDTRLCFSPPEEAAALAVAPSPATETGTVTFGCFQNLGKIGEEVLQAWSRIMRACPDARLWIQNKQMDGQATQALFASRLSAAGIAAERVTLHGPLPRGGYLTSYAQVDLLLDTFPYPGGTTTCEALWMGVPTLTLAGRTLLSRQGASMMACAGLQDWIASDVDDYVNKAVAHAGQVQQLALLRSGLRDRVQACALFDARLFARRLEEALLTMWAERAGA
jgi:predicted O-linked N-acetylglucosamine transferase (SPINDLY family)